MSLHLLLANSEGAEVVWGLPREAWHLLNFIVFAGIVGWALVRSLKPMLAERSKNIRKEIEEAQALRTEMTEKFRDYETRLATIDAQMETMVSEARTEAEAERKRIVDDAKKTAERMKSDARQIADQEVERARHELLNETLALARNAAADAIQKHVTADDQKRLAEEFLDHVGDENA